VGDDIPGPCVSDQGGRASGRVVMRASAIALLGWPNSRARWPAAAAGRHRLQAVLGLAMAQRESGAAARPGSARTSRLKWLLLLNRKLNGFSYFYFPLLHPIF
jgi:hypothetical protein